MGGVTHELLNILVAQETEIRELRAAKNDLVAALTNVRSIIVDGATTGFQ
jgi:hypothetical protein